MIGKVSRLFDTYSMWIWTIGIGTDLFLIQMFYALCAGTADVVAESLL